jgi:hypothetical protein
VYTDGPVGSSVHAAEATRRAPAQKRRSLVLTEPNADTMERARVIARNLLELRGSGGRGQQRR